MSGDHADKDAVSGSRLTGWSGIVGGASHVVAYRWSSLGTQTGVTDLRVPLGRRRKRWRSPGLTVALLGPDGAGKSTLAAGLCERLPLDTRVYYLGAFRATPAEWRVRRLPGIAFATRLAAIWHSIWAGYRHRARGGVAVFDRYTYDGLLPTTGWRARIKSALIARAAPAPDLVILLDAAPELLFARKREHSPAILAAYRRSYLALSHRLPHMVIVDAAQTAEDVLAAATSAVQARWIDRYGTWPAIHVSAP